MLLLFVVVYRCCCCSHYCCSVLCPRVYIRHIDVIIKTVYVKWLHFYFFLRIVNRNHRPWKGSGVSVGYRSLPFFTAIKSRCPRNSRTHRTVTSGHTCESEVCLFTFAAKRDWCRSIRCHQNPTSKFSQKFSCLNSSPFRLYG